MSFPLLPHWSFVLSCAGFAPSAVASDMVSSSSTPFLQLLLPLLLQLLLVLNATLLKV